MSIGLFDGDLAVYKNVCFNLELMKMATYYRKKGEVVALTTTFSPDKYSRFIFRKDYDDGVYPPGVGKNKTIEYGGYAFTNGLYIPMEPKIESTYASPSIYLKYQNLICNTKCGLARFQAMMNGQHIRLSTDGKNLMQDIEKQINPNSTNKIIFLHDNNIHNIDGAYDFLTQFYKNFNFEKYVPRYSTKFPILVDNLSELLQWYSLPSNEDLSILITQPQSTEDIIAFLRQTKRKTLNVLYNVTGGQNDYQQFCENTLPEIYKQATILRSNMRNFSLIYDEDFFMAPEWGQAIDLINKFIEGWRSFPKNWTLDSLYDDTMKQFCSSFRKQAIRNNPFTKQQAREIFYFLYDNSPKTYYHFQKLNYLKLIEEFDLNDLVRDQVKDRRQ